MLALVRDAAGEGTAVNGTGRSSADAHRFSQTGGASVTVPGLIGGWTQAHRLWGRLELSQVLGHAIALATTGIRIDAALARARDQQRQRLLDGGAATWSLMAAHVGSLWRQPELVQLLAQVADDFGDGFYSGDSAAAMVAAVGRNGGSLRHSDFLLHTTPVGEPVTVNYDGGRLVAQPPTSQGVLLALAATAADAILRNGAVESLDHLLVEITEAALAHRSDCADAVTVLGRPLQVDAVNAGHRGGPRAYLHTARVAAADSSGMVVSSLISVFDDFGSGVCSSRSWAS